MFGAKGGPVTHFDHSPAVDRLINGGPPPESWGGPARPLPPRPLPRHLAQPKPRRSDIGNVTRLRRYRAALSRIVGRAA